MTVCVWCERQLAGSAAAGVAGSARARRADAQFCSKRCRQTAWRLRRRRVPVARLGEPLRFAYADPPYPGKAWMYRGEASFGGEVDHAALVARLERHYPDGWALSTSAAALREVLPLCPPAARVCAWVKPHGAAPASFGLHNCWEPLIVVGGRQLPPGVRDWLSALPARAGGELPGRKPLAFCAWLFDCLGMRQGDELDDLFPGTGIVARAWRELSSVDGRRLPVVLDACKPSPTPRGTGHPSRLEPRPVGEDPEDVSEVLE